MIEKILQEVTFKTLKEIKEYDICVPLTYNEVFMAKLREVDASKIDNFENLYKETQMKALEERMRSSEKIIHNAEEIISNAVRAITEQNKDELLSLKKEMNNMFQKIEEITKEIYTDELTKISNRKWLFKKFLINESILPEDGCLAFIDLNDFKIINDTVGHHAGDKSLIFFSSFLKSELSRLGAEFELIRFAGDEFIVIFRSLKLNAKLLLEQIHDALQKKTLKYNGVNLKEFKLGFSFGLMMYNKGDDIHEVLGQADSSMYKMKKIRKIKRIEDSKE